MLHKFRPSPIGRGGARLGMRKLCDGKSPQQGAEAHGKSNTPLPFWFKCLLLLHVGDAFLTLKAMLRGEDWTYTQSWRFLSDKIDWLDSFAKIVFA
jgi:hypothetical protein